MNIITNNKPRVMHAVADLPEKAQAQFYYIMDDDRHTARLVQYKGHWYDVYDTQAIVNAENSPFASWHSIVSETFFSGVLFRFADDEVIVGRYFA